MENYKNINFFLVVVLLYCLNFTVVDANQDTAHPNNEVTLNIITKEGEIFVKLRETESFLANENLPLWIVKGNQPEQLIADNEVMNDIGQFSIYQNSDDSAAAVYFFNRQKFFGTIDSRFIIKAVPIEEIETPFLASVGQLSGITLRHPDHGNLCQKKSESKEYPSSSSHSPQKHGKQKVFRTQSSISSGQYRSIVVYIKILIIINYDTVQRIRGESDKSDGIVRYVLTLMNSVDMLFSKIDEPTIRINIAGIIMGTTRESFPFLAACYKQSNEHGRIKNYMDTSCTNSAIESYLQRQANVISPSTYNIAIFLTSYDIRYQFLWRHQLLNGRTSNPANGPYNVEKTGSIERPIITVFETRYWESYPVIAHEVAHALRLHSHDQAPFVDEDGNCCAYIMKPGGKFCQNCLSWSPATRKHLRSFFRSNERCFFINRPHSLDKPTARIIMTANEQCECYGYKRVGVAEQSLFQKFLELPIKQMCETNLHCYDKQDKLQKAPFPMDGTPCGEKTDNVAKVCWNKKCQELR